MRVVAIEEHYSTPELLQATGVDFSWMADNPHDRLIDTADARLADMDAAGVDVQVLSASGPGVQVLPADTAIPMARTLNTSLHDSVVARHPDRFAAFATLPMGDPAAAVAELEHTVTQLGFVGALVNGTTGGRFLDHPDFDPLLETAARLGVPLYLHPGVPPKAVLGAYYSDLPHPLGLLLATTGYGWHYETSLHALRLVVTGAFDRHPGLKVVLGHLGEGLPFHLDRIEDTVTPLAGNLAKPVSAYFRENFWVTTSAYFFDGPLQLTREAFGDDRVIFSVDYPFSDNKRGTDWLQNLALEPGVRARIAHANADELLGLG
ncbi:amidohydrolase family protein [Streptomyces sp. NPDC057002]|uniref:amidohydrolase family protein n=1 Tax=Streptomyces sp. NPDC057002 TaxID=3345992 RepID=UPI00363A06C6